MPIMKYDRLENLINKVKKSGYTKEITTEVLHRFIAKDFGITMRTRRNIMKLLDEFGLIKEAGIGVWRITQKKEKVEKRG